MGSNEGDCRVVVVGAGAGGTLVATHLVTALSSRFRVELVDPVATTGRGQAYSTTDDRHLLNVPASGMSAFPRDPEHFLRWLRNHHDPDFQPHEFAPRAVFGRYVESLLTTAAEFPGNARLVRRRAEVVDVEGSGTGFVVELSDGERLEARAVVLATSSRPGTGWAPPELAVDPRLVADPWTQPIPEEGDVLLLGSGLTMVDLAISADRPGRTLHVVSRSDAVPHPHVLPTTPPVPPPPGITRTQGLDALRSTLAAHVASTVESTGDWRAAVDGLRPVTAQLWRGLSEADKRRFIAEDARTWDVHRHRMAPATARRLDAVAAGGRLVRHRGTIAAVRADDDALHVTLDDGTELSVAAVVNCTGPVGSIAADPLLARLAHSGLVRPGPAGLGIDTADDGRIVGTLPETRPFLAVGSLRRGNLWESTAMPEIREQAYDVARVVGRSLHGESRRRPVDPYGLTLSTNRRAAARYNAALGRLLRLQGGVEEGLAQAVAADEGFVQAHAALALLGHEWGATTHWQASLRAAHRAAAERHLDDRESSFLDAVTTRLRTDEATGAAALLRHVRLFPRDALAVSVAVPTVAFGGLTSGTQTAELVESLGRSYGDDWWYAGQLAFVRQDQERWAEAEDLSSYALSVEPASGHAVHARAHVFYETGDHAAGLAWLDEWIRTRGPEANHRSHFSWHAALHELMQDDVEAVRRRFRRELDPAVVSGSRVVVDSGSLLWRGRVTGAWTDDLPVREVRAKAPAEWLRTPPTPFAAMHGAVLLAADGDAAALTRLSAQAAQHEDRVFRDVVAPLCTGLVSVVEERWDAAAATLADVVTTMDPLGGSKAQREVVEDTLVHVLAMAGRNADAAALLDHRLSRRSSALDARRRAAVTGAASDAAGSTASADAPSGR
ncbi:NAD(P)-binding protein [Nocardioides sp. zg-1308]|uniref:FAD/NAD(P)-binding protein n=1 Tax=Nocardioides renjunii TaxID=3095075 RepID=A0ABU5KCS8_9ACTN|nr:MULTISPECIES: FAD/NAD(P)-binding protein [unclassified Nocardioides]MDZ5662632.1 FAD/NAD(P)-binding protein [Nocardioides sp. S-58]NPD05699.1 NAD(P)-binding protein [Nocardioides sp. zg-1308]WQQ23579.1 FAD/NAD(P)-binding protein [Nocardioides sp. S-34]